MADHDPRAREVLGQHVANGYEPLPGEQNQADLALEALSEANPPLIVVDAAEWERWNAALREIADSLHGPLAVTGEGHEQCIFIAREAVRGGGSDG